MSNNKDIIPQKERDASGKFIPGHKIIPINFTQEVRKKISDAKKKYKFTEEHRQKLSKAHKANPSKYWLGKKFSDEYRKKLSISHIGKKQTAETRRKRSEKLKGDKCHLWRGGKVKENKILRHSVEYKLWRESVFKRDNWTCIWCGQRGGVLNADHIKPWCDYPELRFSIDNGRTLCIGCHKTTDNYLVKPKRK